MTRIFTLFLMEPFFPQDPLNQNQTFQIMQHQHYSTIHFQLHAQE